MDKMKMRTPDVTDKNIERLAALFPNVITEIKDESGAIKKAVDFDLLKQVLSKDIVEGDDERYRLDWPGKKAALLKANMPLTKTLRPCREESVNFDTTENLYIEGDNFEVLKILQESYLGKVKMIYIDPPYNTGNDFIYKDNFAKSKVDYDEVIGVENEEGGKLFRNTDSNGRFHSDWLSMMYERMVVARDLLRDDGVIFISIDDNEVHDIRKICDEIFGEDQFLSTLIWNKQHSQQQGLFKRYHEYVLVYAKDEEAHSNIGGGEGVIEAGALKKISKANPASEFEFPLGVRIEASDGAEFSGTFGDSEKVTVISGVLRAVNNKTTEKVVLSAGWTQKDQMAKYFSGQEVFDSKGQRVIEFFFSSTGKLKCKKERSKITPPTLLPEYGMVSAQSKALAELLESNIFDNPKPVKMLMDFGMWFTDDDIILDFFSGSATTAHAVMQLNAEDGGNRKFIMVQLPEKTDENSEAYKAGYKTIADIGKERIRRAGKKIVEELKSKNKQLQLGEEPVDASKLDIGFRVYKTDDTNMKDVFYHPAELNQKQLAFLESNIKEDRTPEDLLTQMILDLGLELSLPVETKKILKNTVFIVQTNALVACFDSDIDFKIVDSIAALKPFKVVFKDDSFKDDKDRINVEERFKRLSPETRVTVI